jgi:hypothetical protein
MGATTTPTQIQFVIPSELIHQQAPSQEVRPLLASFANSSTLTVRNTGQGLKMLQEYCDALGADFLDLQTALQDFVAYFNGTVPSIGVAQKATFWIGLGANQPAATAVTGWAAAFTFEQNAAVWNTAVWKYCLIYAITPPTSEDFIMDLRLNGTSIFTSAKLKLPNGTAALTAVVATNFAAPSAAIAEESSMILADVIQSGPEVVGVCAILMFDLKVT